MARSKSIPESLFEQAQHDFNSIKDSKVLLKLMAILAYKDNTSEAVAKIFHLSQRHFQKIIHDYQLNGIDALRQHPRGHNPSKLNKPQLAEIKQWIISCKNKNGKEVNWTLSKLQKEIKTRFHIEISTVAIWNHLHAMGLVIKVPRPTHHKGSKEKQAEFKKN